MDYYLGEIRQFAFYFAPRGWALCNGQLMPIQQYSALFALLGTYYGGDGKTTFGLPNLQGRVPLGMDPNANWPIGAEKGSDSVELTQGEMPTHNHAVIGLNNAGTKASPETGCYLGFDARGGSGVIRYMQANVAAPSTTLAPTTLGPSGGSTAHENRQPFLALSYCIAISDGIFPPRN